MSATTFTKISVLSGSIELLGSLDGRRGAVKDLVGILRWIQISPTATDSHLLPLKGRDLAQSIKRLS